MCDEVQPFFFCNRVNHVEIEEIQGERQRNPEKQSQQEHNRNYNLRIKDKPHSFMDSWEQGGLYQDASTHARPDWGSQSSSVCVWVWVCARGGGGIAPPEVGGYGLGL